MSGQSQKAPAATLSYCGLKAVGEDEELNNEEDSEDEDGPDKEPAAAAGDDLARSNTMVRAPAAPSPPTPSHRRSLLASRAPSLAGERRVRHEEESLRDGRLRDAEGARGG